MPLHIFIETTKGQAKALADDKGDIFAVNERCLHWLGLNAFTAQVITGAIKEHGKEFISASIIRTEDDERTHDKTKFKANQKAENRNKNTKPH